MTLLVLDPSQSPTSNPLLHFPRIAAIVIDELDTIKMQSERMMGALFDESVVSVPLAPSIPMAAPDTGFVNMIQTGLLYLKLSTAPDASSSSRTESSTSQM